MGKKREEMTPEEQAAVKENMNRIRQLALEKRRALAAERKAVEENLQKEKYKVNEKKEKLLKKYMNEHEKLEKMIKAKEDEQEPLPEFEPPELSTIQRAPITAPPPKGAKAYVPMPPYEAVWNPAPGRSAIEDFFYFEKLREQMKQKYKTKYRPAPPPSNEPPANPIQGTAKDELKAKVDDEVRRMAYQSLFGKPM